MTPPSDVNFFAQDSRSAIDAKTEAQRIAFAPIAFQVCRVARDNGLLEIVRHSRAHGITLNEAAAKLPLPRYGIKVLLEAGLGIGLFCLNDERFTLTKLGYLILADPMTRVNMDFTHEICYRGMFQLDEAIARGEPVGLKSLGDYKTLYEGLSSFPPETQRSWLAFDHYYSDAAFPVALPLVFANKPKRLLDVGGNTGRWAIQCAKFDPDVHITIADLPQQLELARKAIADNGLAHRIDLHSVDLLDHAQPLPTGFDAIWMSQFLDCFSEAEIVSILRRTAAAMSPETRLFILELFWDRQPNESAAFCLQQTSIYFTVIANGNSQMYHSADLIRCLNESGLVLENDRNEVGLYHTLLTCRRA